MEDKVDVVDPGGEVLVHSCAMQLAGGIENTGEEEEYNSSYFAQSVPGKTRTNEDVR